MIQYAALIMILFGVISKVAIMLLRNSCRQGNHYDPLLGGGQQGIHYDPAVQGGQQCIHRDPFLVR